VLLGEIVSFTHFKVLTWIPESDLAKFKPNEVTFRDLAVKKPQETYIVLLGMPSSWSYTGISKGNKENVVTALANLSIEDSESNIKLTSSPNKPKGEKRQFIGGWLCLLSAVPTNSSFEAPSNWAPHRQQHASSHCRPA
jgi:hypothetical protein